MQTIRMEKVTNDQGLPRVDSQHEGSLANVGGDAVMAFKIILDSLQNGSKTSVRKDVS